MQASYWVVQHPVSMGLEMKPIEEINQAYTRKTIQSAPVGAWQQTS